MANTFNTTNTSFSKELSLGNTTTFSDLFKSLANNFTTNAIISSINKTLVKKYNLAPVKVEQGEYISVSNSEHIVDFETLVTEPLGISKKSIDLQSNQKLWEFLVKCLKLHHRIICGRPIAQKCMFLTPDRCQDFLFETRHLGVVQLGKALLVYYKDQEHYCYNYEGARWLKSPNYLPMELLLNANVDDVNKAIACVRNHVSLQA